MLDWPAGRDRAPSLVEVAAPFIGEDHAIGIIGVPIDAELAQVMKPMMSLAERDQIGRIGSTAVLPMDDVMDV
ncbi:MAG: hypothetical protein QOI99_1273 [Actinomycetota bacterium]|nr:hypothetical protein [Actinomycetota bacterium]